MDGFQVDARLKESLQFRLSAWFLLVILGTAVAAGALSFAFAFDEAIDLQDDQLTQIAALMDPDHLPGLPSDTRKDVPIEDRESLVFVQLLPQPGVQSPVATKGTLALPPDLPEGLQTITVQNEGWRLFVTPQGTGSRIVVGQRNAVRDEIARKGALITLLPILVLIPVLLLLVGNLIRKMFKPVTHLAVELDGRSEHDLREINGAGLPSEIRPFVTAINLLLSRVAHSVAMQRRFVADAAHELRSPLTALSLQAERLEAAQMSAEAKERLGVLRSGLHRTRLLVEQLLTLARLQEPVDGHGARASALDVFRQVIEDLMPLAEAKRIDLGVVGDLDAEIAIPIADLKTLVKNLVENAIRFTPQGGRVDLSVHPMNDHVILQVDDTGPGIPVKERDRVFDPFYRVLGSDEPGSGLGLSIVKSIAARHAAEINLGNSGESAGSFGLRVTIKFPLR